MTKKLLKHPAKPGCLTDLNHDRKSRIGQLRVSRGVVFFRQKLIDKYGLNEYSSLDDPAVFYGMYDRADYLAALKHRGHLTILWRGNDARQIPGYARCLLRIMRARHIANSEFTSESLRRAGIPHSVLPITPTINIKNPQPRGDAIYFYTSKVPGNTYGDAYVEDLKGIIPQKIIIAHSQSHTGDELKDIYKSCFIGLRLTKHDGLPNTVCEMGLMGRRCIYNGILPNAIPYRSLDDIVRAIHAEYENRFEDNSGIADAMHDFLDIGDSWLYV